MKQLDEFIKEWQADAMAALGVTRDPTWCPVCETRETRKAFTPYCSQICLEAAKRKELCDRR